MRTDIKRTMEQARMEMDILSKVYSKVRLLSRDELCVDIQMMHVGVSHALAVVSTAKTVCL